MLIALEDVYRVDYSQGCPLVVLDLRVLIWRITHRFMELYGNLPEQRFKNWIKCQAAISLNNPIPYISFPYGFRLIVVDDIKDEKFSHEGDIGEGNYWRNEYCRELGLPEYKGNRGGDQAKPDFYKGVYEGFLEYIGLSGVPYFADAGWEADDWASLICKYHRERCSGRHLLLSTVDSDWLQLVSDSDKIFWCSPRTFGHRSKMRGFVEAVEYSQKMYARPLCSPKAIALIKQELGDKSDNLLPGSPLGLFDLIEPFEYPEDYGDLLRKQTLCTASTVDKGRYGLAKDYLAKIQMTFLEN